MAVVEASSRFERVRDLLKKAADGQRAAFGDVELWSLPYDQFIAQRLMELPLIVTRKGGHSSCKSSAPDPGSSALLLGLRGQQTFDGAQFPRLPWGRPAMADGEIAEIAEWISMGAPEKDSETAVYTFPEDEWKTESAKV